MNLLNLGVFAIVFFLTCQYSAGLYEDQIGKFDWRKRHVGKLISSSTIEKNCNQILVATEENVIAALSIETGDIIWRQVLEKAPRGEIKYVYFRPESNNMATSLRYSSHDYDVITVTGTYPIFVRGWSKITGNLVFEWSPALDPKGVMEWFWFYKDNHLYHVVPREKSYIEITQYDAISGEIKVPTTKISTSWPFNGHPECYIVDTYYMCTDTLNRRRLFAKDLSDDKPYVEKYLDEEIRSAPKSVPGYSGVIIINDRTVVILNNILSKYDAFHLRETLDLALKTDFAQVIKYEENDVLLTASVRDETLRIEPYYLGQSKIVQGLQMNIPFTKEYGPISQLSYTCYKTSNGKPTCSALIGSADGAILFVKDGRIQWVREEALARIAAVEFIDLPLSGTQSDFEIEIQKTTDHYGKTHDIWGAFIRRIQSQLHLLKNTHFYIFGNQPERQKSEITRDAFGLHKMLVILTENGKLFGIDNISGEKHWAIYHPSFAKFNNHENMRIIVQRTSKYTPHQPLCTILAKDQKTGNGIIYRFSPISGHAFDDDGPVKLNYKIKQMAMLRENEKDHTKGILLLDEDNEIHVIPQNATHMAEGMYLYVANKTTAIIDGYYIQSSEGKLGLIKVWTINLGGIRQPQNLANPNHMIIAIAAKNPIERVHSQGRVLGDRSVLYKYLNPNLVAIVTASVQSYNRDMNVHLVDVVSGSIVYSMTHRKVRGPVHIVNSENWLVYSYFNEKARRTEITTVELYEGKVQSNSTVWSSLEAPPMPIIEKQSFIIPTTVEAMRETITERGITNKHVLIGTSSGGVIEMAWALLDPRRPTTNQAREEGSIPYIPELGIPSETVINYNQSIARLKDISTAPSGLESTCLVVAYGLDLFVTRVSPSKTFDLLKEDFDYTLISLVLIGLLVVSCIVQHLSSRKALKQAWK